MLDCDRKGAKFLHYSPPQIKYNYPLIKCHSFLDKIKLLFYQTLYKDLKKPCWNRCERCHGVLRKNEVQSHPHPPQQKVWLA